ncbi:DNA repair protein endonuclease SAE2/CtIP C-terminus-domain-containing protein [Nemania sp. FL0031]|nr:DNA repair protein endonuclease SAE2/CtIP C-terminus-domain-containing protein [Nemania sp. FL0031]
MENWFGEVGRTVLLEALGDACDRISNSFKTDFQTYSQDKLNLAAELETLRHKASQVSRLEEENIALRGEIKALREAAREQTDPPNTASHTMGNSALRTPLAPRSANKSSSRGSNQLNIEGLSLPELKEEFFRIDKKHAKLHNKYLDLQGALLKSNQLLRERTTTNHRWVDHAKQLSEQSLRRAQRIKKLEARLAEVSQGSLNSSFSSDAGELEVEVAAEPMLLTPLPPSPRQQSNISVPSLAPVPRFGARIPGHIDDGQRSKSPLRARSLSGSRRSTSTSSTSDLRGKNDTNPRLPPLPQNQKHLERDPHIKSEPSSDTPVVVSERCIRKRKYPGGNEDDTATFVKLKMEHSPEPQNNDDHRRPTPHESIDFDTEYHRVETPRKHTRHQQTHNIQNGNLGVGGRDSSVETTNLDNPNSQDSRNPVNEKFTGDTAASDFSGLVAETDSALQSLNNNEALRSRLNLASGSRNRKISARRRGLASLAEDGYQDENLHPPSNKDRPGSGVLEVLLNTPSPAQENEAIRSSSSAETRSSSDLYFQLPKRRELPFGKDGRKSVGATPKGSPNMTSNQPISLSTNQGRDKAKERSRSVEKKKTGAPTLRQTPKARLRLEDFKINPQANEGYDYAFTDVVRNKDDRACLQGCVKENCCGNKFRALAQACRPNTRPHEFQSLLESYLGDDCHRLSTMSEAEKETLWIEAKTKELAKNSGRHRYRYSRMTTPPGFWRPDFPSTQEGEEYNEEAAELERKIIEERYREAMRPGGLWIFRDE